MILEKTSTVINNCIKYLCIILMVMLLILMTTEVVLRYIFNSSLVWSNDLVMILMAWLTFLGASIAVKEKAHFAIPILADKFKEKEFFFSLVVDLISLTFFGLLFIGGCIITKNSLHQDLMSLPGKWYMVYMIVPITSFASIVHLAVDLVNSLRMRSTQS